MAGKNEDETNIIESLERAFFGVKDHDRQHQGGLSILTPTMDAHLRLWESELDSCPDAIAMITTGPFSRSWSDHP
jgi:hypothetical protein